MQDIVIKIGGSVIYKENLELNLQLLEKIKYWYQQNSKRYNKVVFVTGGGKLSRSLGNNVNEYISNIQDKHGVAMLITQTSSAILKGYMDIPNSVIPESLGDAFEMLNDDKVKVVFSGGLKRGWSTDMDAVVFADVLNLKKVIKISNVDYLYNKDPNQFTDAKPIYDISWKKYVDMFSINESHKVNGNIPISNEASEFCMNRDISFQISGGKDIYGRKSLATIMQEGTLIHP